VIRGIPFDGRRPDNEARDSTVAVRGRREEHLACAGIATRANDSVGGEHFGRIEHANPERAMAAVHHRGFRRCLFGVGGDCRRKAPAARSSRDRTCARLDAVDRARPLGEADVVGVIRSGTLHYRGQDQRELLLTGVDARLDWPDPAATASIKVREACNLDPRRGP